MSIEPRPNQALQDIDRIVDMRIDVGLPNIPPQGSFKKALIKKNLVRDEIKSSTELTRWQKFKMLWLR